MYLGNDPNIMNLYPLSVSEIVKTIWPQWD